MYFGVNFISSYISDTSNIQKIQSSRVGHLGDIFGRVVAPMRWPGQGPRQQLRCAGTIAD